jgi:hypothetical protein
MYFCDCDTVERSAVVVCQTCGENIVPDVSTVIHHGDGAGGTGTNCMDKNVPIPRKKQENEKCKNR